MIGTGKRTGKTAVASHWAALLREAGVAPVIVCMGRADPPSRGRGGGHRACELLDRRRGDHAASDYLEDAVRAGVRTGSAAAGSAGASRARQPSRTCPPGSPGRLAPPGHDHLRGLGRLYPPVEADRTVCVVGAGPAEPFAEYRLERADLVLAAEAPPRRPAP